MKKKATISVFAHPFLSEFKLVLKIRGAEEEFIWQLGANPSDATILTARSLPKNTISPF
jgi:hypothetical protein